VKEQREIRHREEIKEIEESIKTEMYEKMIKETERKTRLYKEDLDGLR
jgi:hypothetical protein